MIDSLLLGYLGPETLLPLASVFAAIAGALLVCWRTVLCAVSRVLAVLTGRRGESDSIGRTTETDVDSVS